VPLKRVGLELSVERALSPTSATAPDRARMTVRFEFDPAGSSPTAEEIAQALADIATELEVAAAGLGHSSATASRPDRPLAELVETYHPRQRELIDLLAAEGELTSNEAASLAAHLGGPAPEIPPAHPLSGEEPPITDRPLAAMPLVNDRTPVVARPVDRLIAEYRIESLKQAGAVRARRQISYEEYMALKRRFAQEETAPAVPGPG
jgi:hypothetical protein